MTIMASGRLWQIIRCLGARPGILLQIILAPRATTDEKPLGKEDGEEIETFYTSRLFLLRNSTAVIIIGLIRVTADFTLIASLVKHNYGHDSDFCVGEWRL